MGSKGLTLSQITWLLVGTCWSLFDIPIFVWFLSFTFNPSFEWLLNRHQLRGKYKMVASQPIGIDSIPEEIRDQIIRNIPVTDLLKVMLSSWALCRQAKPHLYRSVYYLVRSAPTQHKFALLRNHTGAYDPDYSAQIIRPAEFLRTITVSPGLRSYIDEVSFSIQEDSDEGETEAIKKCLGILNPSTLHLTLANKHANIALTSTVTSLDIMYPAEEVMEEEEFQDWLCDQIYSLFNISTLRHLCLRGARCWNAFSPIPDNTRVGTSNVVSLSLPNTVPTDTDLKEILTWPKGLKCIHHKSEEGENGFFQLYLYTTGEKVSLKRFLQGIASQRESLEEVSYNNGMDISETDGSTFSPVLMSEFSKLTHLCVPHGCFVDENGEPHPLYTVLPPNLQKLYLDHYDNVHNVEYQARRRGWLQQILDHKKECFPSLKTVVLWQCPFHTDYHANAHAILERLYVLFPFPNSSLP